MALRFHLDEHIPHAVAMGLKARGFDVTTTVGANLQSDDEIPTLEVARQQQPLPSIVDAKDDAVGVVAGVLLFAARVVATFADGALGSRTAATCISVCPTPPGITVQPSAAAPDSSIEPAGVKW